MTNPAEPSRPIVGRYGLSPVLSVWWAELNWPRIIASARLGIRPGRLGLAFFAIIISFLLLSLGLWIDGAIFKRTVLWPEWPWTPGAKAEEHLLLFWRAAVTLPKRLFWGLPITTIVVIPLALAIWTTMMGAISRITACELSHGRCLTWSEGLSFAAPRWRSLFGAILGPLLVVWLIAVVMTLGGWVLMHLPGLNIVGALLYPLWLFGGFLATVVLLGYALGHNLLIPSVVCEGSDAIDAIQRAYTYFFARPLRLVFYTVAGSIGLAIVMAIVVLVARMMIGFAAESAAVWSGPDGKAMVWRGTYDAVTTLPAAFCIHSSGPDTPAGTWTTGAWLIRFWTTIPVILVLAAWISCGISVCTAMYLGMRRVCDGQDWAELWTPGLIPGTMAQSMAGRARVAQELGTPQATGPIDEPEDE